MLVDAITQSKTMKLVTQSGWILGDLFSSILINLYSVFAPHTHTKYTGYCTDYFFSFQGLKNEVAAFFIMMFTLIMVAYTASSMALAIAAGQSVVSVATLLMTISFVFMMVSMDSASP